MLIGLGLVPRTGGAQSTRTWADRELYFTKDPTRATCLMPVEREAGEAISRCYVIECDASGDHCACPIKLPNGWMQPLTGDQCRQLGLTLRPLPPVEPGQAIEKERAEAPSPAKQVEKDKPEARPMPDAVPIPSPPGDCPQEQHSALQNAVNAACKVPRRCDTTQDCATLRLNHNRNLACARARDAINKTCFRGGDSVHRKEVENAYATAARCAELIKSRKCD